MKLLTYFTGKMCHETWWDLESKRARLPEHHFHLNAVGEEHNSVHGLAYKFWKNKLKTELRNNLSSSVEKKL